jgi:hypothetical protein
MDDRFQNWAKGSSANELNNDLPFHAVRDASGDMRQPLIGKVR